MFLTLPGLTAGKKKMKGTMLSVPRPLLPCSPEDRAMNKHRWEQHGTRRQAHDLVLTLLWLRCVVLGGHSSFLKYPFFSCTKQECLELLHSTWKKKKQPLTFLKSHGRLKEEEEEKKRKPGRPNHIYTESVHIANLRSFSNFYHFQNSPPNLHPQLSTPFLSPALNSTTKELVRGDLLEQSDTLLSGI